MDARLQSILLEIRSEADRIVRDSRARRTSPLATPFTASAPLATQSTQERRPLAWSPPEASATADREHPPEARLPTSAPADAALNRYLGSGGELDPQLDHLKMIRDLGPEAAGQVAKRFRELRVARQRLYGLKPSLFIRHVELLSQAVRHGWFTRPEQGRSR